MEYVEGGNLKDVIEQEAPLPVERVCSIIKQVAAALDAAHRPGLVHRDIKPANIALVGSGARLGTSSDLVKVLDFGIAKLKEAHLEDSKVHPMNLMTLTGTGMVIGTPAYMSPEQAKGLKGEQLDGRSDIYSLGVVAYQMLAGDLPLKADSTLELLMAHINTPPKPIHEVRPDLKIPAAVAGVVMRCLEKNRELRPASAQAMIDEIESAVDRGPALPVRPSAAPTREYVTQFRTAGLPGSPTVTRQSGESHSRWWLRAVAAVLIAGISGGAWYLLGTKPPTKREGQRVAGTSSETEPVLRGEERSARKPAQQTPAARPSEQSTRATQLVRGVKGPEVARKAAEPTSSAAGGDDSAPSQAAPQRKETGGPANADGTTAPEGQQLPIATQTTPVESSDAAQNGKATSTKVTRGQVDCTALGAGISDISLFKSGDIRGDVVARINCGQYVDILNKHGKWFEVRSPSGAHGYLLENTVRGIGESPYKPTSTKLARGRIECVALGAGISDISLFKNGDIRGDVVGRVDCGQYVDILRKYGAWFEIRSPSGAHGYLLENTVRVIGESP